MSEKMTMGGPKMSKYCKAYSVKDLSQFAGWNEHYPRTKTEKQEDGREIKVTVELSDDDYLYLHDNYVVTDDRLKIKM